MVLAAAHRYRKKIAASGTSEIYERTTTSSAATR